MDRLSEKEINGFMSFRKMIERLVCIPDGSSLDVFIKEYSIASCYIALLNMYDRFNGKVSKINREDSIKKVVEIVKRDKVTINCACKKCFKEIKGYKNLQSLATAVYKKSNELGIKDFKSEIRGRKRAIVNGVRHES